MAVKLAKALDEASFEKLDEKVRPFYVKGDDGKYKLDVEVDGTVDKARLDEFRETNVKVLKQRDRLKKTLQLEDDDISDEELEALGAIIAENKKNKDKKMIEEGKLEELLTERTEKMKKDLTKRAEAAETALTAARTKLEALLIDNELTREAVALGVEETGVEDVVLRGRRVFRLHEDKVLPYNGDQVIYGADGKTPVSVKEWLGELAEKAPHLFKGSTGSGAKPGSKPAGGGQVRAKSDLKTAGEKAAYIGKHGRNAFLALPDTVA